MGRPSGHLHNHVQVAPHAAGDVGAVHAEHAADDELADRHAQRAVDEQRAAAGFVDEEKDDGGEDDEERVLHPRGDEVDVAAQPGHLEDVHDVVGHDVCAGELLPGLHGHARERAAPHAVFDEFAPAVKGFALGLQDGGDFFPLGDDEGVFDVPARLDARQDFDGLFGAADFGEPARRAREEGDAEHEACGGDELDAPCGAKGCGAGDEGAAIADEEHDEDAPFDGELLDHDDAPAFLLLGDFGQVDGHLGGCHADADPVEDAAGDEHAEAIAGDLHGGPGEPEETGEEDGVPAADAVGEGPGEDGANDGASSQC